MKTLIVYATKHGATREIAQRIAALADGATLHDLKGGAPSLEGYDRVILGSPVYAGMILKEAKAFAQQNAAALRGKQLALFVSGMDPSKEQDDFAANFPPEIVQAAKAARFLGGIFDPKKAGFMGRLIMKAVAKQTAYTDTIDDARIKQFVEAVEA